jgi:hypothetical protein
MEMPIDQEDFDNEIFETITSLNLKMKNDTAHNVITLLLEELTRNSVHPIVERDIQNQNAIPREPN